MELQDWNQAIDYFSRAIAQRNNTQRVVPSIPLGHWELPFSAPPQPNFIKLESSHFGIKSLPPSGELYLRRARVYVSGLIHLKIYDLREAIEDLNTAIRLNPNFSLAYAARGKTYFEREQWTQSLADFDRALSIDPTLTAAHLGKGLVFLEQQQWQPAAQSFSHTLDADPESLEALDGRAKARKELKDIAGMLADQKRSQHLRDRILLDV